MEISHTEHNEYLLPNLTLLNAMLELLSTQMVELQGITGTLKAQDQLAWVGAMNQICTCVEETILKEVVYV